MMQKVKNWNKISLWQGGIDRGWERVWTRSSELHKPSELSASWEGGCVLTVVLGAQEAVGELWREVVLTWSTDGGWGWGPLSSLFPCLLSESSPDGPILIISRPCGKDFHGSSIPLRVSPDSLALHSGCCGTLGWMSFSASLKSYQVSNSVL